MRLGSAFLYFRKQSEMIFIKIVYNIQKLTLIFLFAAFEYFNGFKMFYNSTV